MSSHYQQRQSWFDPQRSTPQYCIVNPTYSDGASFAQPNMQHYVVAPAIVPASTTASGTRRLAFNPSTVNYDQTYYTPTFQSPPSETYVLPTQQVVYADISNSSTNCQPVIYSPNIVKAMTTTATPAPSSYAQGPIVAYNRYYPQYEEQGGIPRYSVPEVYQTAQNNYSYSSYPSTYPEEEYQYSRPVFVARNPMQESSESAFEARYPQENHIPFRASNLQSSYHQTEPQMEDRGTYEQDNLEDQKQLHIISADKESRDSEEEEDDASENMIKSKELVHTSSATQSYVETSSTQVPNDTRLSSYDQYRCELCNKRFTRLKQLKRHMDVHSSEKKYECEYCRKRFRRRDNLASHRNIHTGETPYACPICDRRFRHQSACINHRRTHTKEKSAECDICFVRFTRKSSLQRHLRGIHGIYRDSSTASTVTTSAMIPSNNRATAQEVRG